MVNKNKELSIDSTIELAKGNYTNAVKVSTTDAETIVDFAFIFPDEKEGNKGVMIRRLIMNHGLAAKLADSLTKTLNEHLKKKK